MVGGANFVFRLCCKGNKNAWLTRVLVCHGIYNERFNTRRDLTDHVLDMDDGGVAIVIIITVERLLLGWVFFRGHDERASSCRRGVTR